jgi:hypothetical protein
MWTVHKNSIAKIEFLFYIRVALSYRYRNVQCGLARLWQSWHILEEGARAVLEAQLRDQSGAISWEKYQDLAGNVLRGSLDDRIGCVPT